MKSLIIASAAALSVCSTSTAPSSEPASSIYWSDGDSGRIDGTDFRLADVDAPETGGVGAAIGGAECERERELGFKAKEFMVARTRNAELAITHRENPDRYGRIVMSISANGVDLPDAGVEAGVLRPWPHDGDRPLAEKPDWCE